MELNCKLGNRFQRATFRCLGCEVHCVSVITYGEFASCLLAPKYCLMFRCEQKHLFDNKKVKWERI